MARELGWKRTVHGRFQTCTGTTVLEQVVHEAGRLVGKDDGYWLFGWFMKGTFTKGALIGDILAPPRFLIVFFTTSR